MRKTKMGECYRNRQNIKAIILAGGRDFGRCPLASRLPTALWPIGSRSALERLLRYLLHQGITEAVVCSNGDHSLLQRSITNINSMRLRFLDEPLPVGTAGCIRDGADGDTKAVLLVLPAAITSPPDLNMLLKTHRTGGSDVTVMFSPGLRHGEPRGCVSEICVCEPAVLRYIPREGYCDIKEGLIPAMVQAGKTVHAAILSQPLGNFRDRAGYLDAVADYLENTNNVNIGFPCSKKDGAKALWLADSAKVARNTRIYGPVVVMDGATVSENTIIFGPTVVGRGATVGQNSLVENSVLWDRSTIGQNCEVRSCVVDYDALIPNNGIVTNQAVVRPGSLKSGTDKSIESVDNKAGQLYSSAKMLTNAMIVRLPKQLQSYKLALDVLKGFAIGILFAVFLWSYWPQLTDLWSIWRRSDEYSSGLLVPLLALYILWS
ncbi:MAG: sugar phosphate nucleotidyltransferase, partial [Planctomycetota bacterium]